MRENKVKKVSLVRLKVLDNIEREVNGTKVHSIVITFDRAS